MYLAQCLQMNNQKWEFDDHFYWIALTFYAETLNEIFNSGEAYVVLDDIPPSALGSRSTIVPSEPQVCAC